VSLKLGFAFKGTKMLNKLEGQNAEEIIESVGKNEGRRGDLHDEKFVIYAVH
jgi:hypothetical protein